MNTAQKVSGSPSLADALNAYVYARRGNTHSLRSLSQRFGRGLEQIQEILAYDKRFKVEGDQVRLSTAEELKKFPAVYLNPIFSAGAARYLIWKGIVYPEDRMGTLADNYLMLSIQDMIIPTARSPELSRDSRSIGDLRYEVIITYANFEKITQIIDYSSGRAVLGRRSTTCGCRMCDP